MYGAPPSRPRVLIVAPGEIFGGAERQILTLINALRSRVSFEALLFFDGPLAARLRAAGIEATVPRSFPAALRQLRSLAREVDVIHVNGYKASIAACLATNLKGSRILKTVHGAPEFKHGSRVASALSRLYYAMELALDSISRPTQVFVTHDLRTRWPAFAVGPGARVVYNGISVGDSVPRRTKPQTPPDLPGRLVMVGRLDFVKGADIAVEALALLERGSARLVLVGDGPERDALMRTCARLDIESAVTFRGFVADPGIELYEADAMLIPSRHEGLPYTLLEAMRAMTPVIASRVGGVAEVLEDGKDAILVPPNDAVALGTAIRSMLADPDYAAALATRARAKLAMHFTDQSMADGYYDAYHTLWSRAR